MAARLTSASPLANPFTAEPSSRNADRVGAVCEADALHWATVQLAHRLDRRSGVSRLSAFGSKPEQPEIFESVRNVSGVDESNTVFTPAVVTMAPVTTSRHGWSGSHVAL